MSARLPSKPGAKPFFPTIAFLLLAACSAGPRPPMLSQADATRSAPLVQAAEQAAPQAFLQAEDLFHQAEEAYNQGDSEQAELLSEHAIAAYEHAVVLARVAVALGRISRADTSVVAAQQELLRLDGEARELESEVTEIEARTKVNRDALPLPKSEPASPERERARQKAALALLRQARLLCVSARLLDPAHPEEEQARLADIARIEQGAGKALSPAPIDAARRLRSQCLEMLYEIRKPKLREQPQSFAAEGLLAELSDAKLFPFRDDRGVVVTLRGVFDPSNKLSPQVAEQLAALGRVAKTHPEFPLLLVLHSAKGKPPETAELEKALRDAGAPNVTSDFAGSSLPIAISGEPGAEARNERAEVVFVSPTP
ncbi:MAG: hypothetical protein SFV15_18225 [Polyangiaceae bacterium]|nr:hypothetical protein [Polyangiaceae bacterium]